MAQKVGINRLGQVFVKARSKRLRARITAPVGRCRHNREPAHAAISVAANLAQQPVAVFTGHADVVRGLADIAAQAGASLVTERPAPALDLGDPFFADDDSVRRRCAEILASPPVFC